MFKTLRKKQNKLDIPQCKSLLKSTRRGVLSINGDNGYPYSIPINYLYDENTNRIIFHGSKCGHKVDLLTTNEKICFTVVSDEIIKDEKWCPFLQSVNVYGRCYLEYDTHTKLSLLKQFALKYYPSEEMVDKEINISINNVQLYVIEIDYISGKQIQER